MSKEIYYISNLISLSRLLLLPVTLFFLITDSYIPACVLIILIWISDLLDGYTARKRNEISELGKIIDPLADKLSVAGIVLVLMFKGLIPWWFVVSVIFRDLLILSGALYLKYRKNTVLQSDRIGQFTVFIIGFTMLITVFFKAVGNQFPEYFIENMELLNNTLLLLSIVMSIFSLTSYFIKFRKIINQ